MAKYQYGTNPRKLEPEVVPNRKKKKVTQNKANPKKQVRKQAKQRVKTKNQLKRKKAKVILGIVLLFGVLLAISYRNSLITENFAKIRNLKTDLAAIQKENQQLEVNIESSLNLKNIEKEAKDTLGMQKLTNDQKVYIHLPKKDYVEPAEEQIQLEEKENIFQKIWNQIQEWM